MFERLALIAAVVFFFAVALAVVEQSSTDRGNGWYVEDVVSRLLYTELVTIASTARERARARIG